MGVKRLGVAPAASAAALPEHHLSIGALVIADEGCAETANDLGVTLVEYFAYIGDVLSFYQDQIANESYLDADWSEEANVVRIHLGAVKGTQTTDRRLSRGARTIGPPSRGRFGSCSSPWWISCCAVWCG